MKWHYKNTMIPDSFENFKKILLDNRDIIDSEAFFSFPSPLDFTIQQLNISETDFSIALDRIKRAKDNNEKVVIFGDYDADGVCATVILLEALKEYGIDATTFIPDRKRHGYGISQKAVEDIITNDKPDLLITVDNGIVAHDPIAWTMQQGIDVIVTDHHQSEDIFPKAYAVLHSTQVCGAGVSWMLAKALSPSTVEQSLDLVAIATVADLVPLTGENRSFVKYGLDLLQETDRVGLNALLVTSGLSKSSIDTRSIGFGISPRINAMGRLSRADKAVDLLTSPDPDTAYSLSQVLEKTNTDRKKVTEDALIAAEKAVSIDDDAKITIVASRDFHEGVVGLIAGKLVEKYAKPAIVMHIDDDITKASARSLPGINIIEIIRQVKEDLIDAGGHPMAAGFSFDTQKKEMVIKKLQDIANKEIDPELLDLSVQVDCQVPFELVTEEFVEDLSVFEPFGKANAQPKVALKEITVDRVFSMGAKKQHIKILGSVEGSNNKLAFIAWNRPDLVQKVHEGMIIDAVGKLEINEWKGNRNVQVMCEDIVLV